MLFPTEYFGGSYLTNPPKPGTAAAIFNDFITELETFLGITRIEIDLDDLWGNSSLAPSHGSLETMLFATYPTLITMDQTRLLAEPFMAEYVEANHGRKPFIDPVPLLRWDYGWSQPADAYEQQLANKTTFMNWFTGKVVTGGDPESCSESILIYPQSSGGTTYRNAYKRCVMPGFRYARRAHG